MSEFALRIATAPVNWNNDDIPGWRDPVPFPDLLDRMAEAGYSASEYDDKFGPEPAEVGVEARNRGLQLCGFYQWVDLLDPNAFASQVPDIASRLDQLGKLGCSHLIVSDPLRPHRDQIAGRVPDDGSSSLPSTEYARIAHHLDELGEMALTHGFSTHYHNHVGTYIETPAEVEALAEAIRGSSVNFCFDTGHFAYGGGNARKFIESHLADIGYLHLKDVDAASLENARANGKSFRDALRDIVFTPLGRGSAEIPAIIAALAAWNFGGWVVIEQDTCEGDPTSNARANLEYVHTALRNEETL